MNQSSLQKAVQPKESEDGEEVVEIFDHNPTKESKAWSTLVHGLHATIPLDGPSNNALTELEALSIGLSDIIFVVSFGFSKEQLGEGSFLPLVLENSSEVIKQFRIKIVAKLDVTHWNRDMYTKFCHLEEKAKQHDPSEACFVIGLRALMFWSDCGTRFLDRPSTTLWKYWAENHSRFLLGKELLGICRRVARLTRTAVHNSGTTNPDALELCVNKSRKRKVVDGNEKAKPRKQSSGRTLFVAEGGLSAELHDTNTTRSGNAAILPCHPDFPIDLPGLLGPEGRPLPEGKSVDCEFWDSPPLSKVFAKSQETRSPEPEAPAVGFKKLNPEGNMADATVWFAEASMLVDMDAKIPENEVDDFRADSP